MSNWIRIAAVSEVAEGRPCSAEVEGKRVGVYRIEGEYFAIGDICTHAFALLSTGFIEGDTVECPLHQACFSIKTGEALSAPATEPVETFPVRVEGDDVFVDVSNVVTQI
ncbi:MAG: non-heme iron oxygenase ferredoxin subunit [Pigmentiphaga sp.]